MAMRSSFARFCARLALCALACLLCVSGAGATWSIVVVNTRTREVCVAAATCLDQLNLKTFLALVRVEHGAAAAQSAIDFSAVNRRRIWRGFDYNIPPQTILDAIKTIDPQVQSRQFGIVDFRYAPVTFTGAGAGIAKGGIAGIDGDLRYAIQGNVLVGEEILHAAQTVLLDTPGDLGQKVMAAMLVARYLGGDGRCSCDPAAPTSCGVPPPGFAKSAHVAFMVLARMGDVDGVCQPLPGCANGNYFLDLNVIGSFNDPDPVDVLQGLYNNWRAGKVGKPDQQLSLVLPSADALPADGLSSASVDLRLVDIDGTPLSQGGAAVTLERLQGGTPFTSPGPVVDNGDGTYRFELQAGLQPGIDLWRITVDDGVRPVVLRQHVEIRVEPVTPLHVGRDRISAGQGGNVPLVLNMGAANAGQPYLLLASGSGTTPGTPFQGITVPLNDDWLYQLTLTAPNTGTLQATSGTLDANGRATAEFLPTPGFLAPFTGGTVHWAAVQLGAPPTTTAPMPLPVVP